MTTLLALCRKAITGESLPEEVLCILSQLSTDGWEGLYGEAKRQSVTGLFYRGLADLPVDVPDSVSFPLVTETVRLETRSRELAAAAADLIVMFGRKGLHPMEMKGAAVAAMYPDPGLREYGDIDLYFPGGEAVRAAEILKLSGVNADSAPDGSFHFYFRDISVDVHDRYFDLYGKAAKPEPGTPEAMLLMLSAHLLKHAAGPGAGLRQVCDLAAAYRSLDGKYDPEALREYCARNGIGAWNKLACSFLSGYLGIPDRLYPANAVSPAPLLRIVSEGGNFGHHSASRSRAVNSSGLRRKADTAMRFLKHLPFSLRYAAPATLSSLAILVKGNLKT